ncbi:hypothetical protein LN042_24155 [Kitasatospora sp. RB6PN24]|uniref:hypothetical protein n=1 Tax=Kitasatospora humi TaxID=2893891 RepID=UPI001E57B9FE|nr:hypothetical protein [Kitasatospora humi]MCC9310123.1 hypothetical protein [Kitasatospora humi]
MPTSDPDAPIEPLSSLVSWLEVPANRKKWRDCRINREAALIKVERDLANSEDTATPHEVAVQRERVEHARARAKLAMLAEDFAEQTRLWSVLTILDFTEDDADQAELRRMALELDAGVRDLMVTLTQTDFIYPVEAARTADQLLGDLTHGYIIWSAIGSKNDLEKRVNALDTALGVMDRAPRP